jgi:hypothetical protein
MSHWQLQTPVAFIIFNRPDTTAQVFSAIAAARPPRLLLVADGARAGRAGEAERCASVRELAQRIDWPCELQTNLSEVNLGCRARVSSGIDWVFEQVSEAIILEDDCLPHPTFFRYCDELLQRYRDDERVGMICGDNFQFGRAVGNGDYYFSKYAHIWGWASWRRAWENYDVRLRCWPEFLASGAIHRLTENCEREFWIDVFGRLYAGLIDTWDYQWTFGLWAHSMLNLMPQVNLVSNIGFGPEATHTRGASRLANLVTQASRFPLRAPALVSANREADLRTAEMMFAQSRTRRLKLRWRRATRGRQPAAHP